MQTEKKDPNGKLGGGVNETNKRSKLGEKFRNKNKNETTIHPTNNKQTELPETARVEGIMFVPYTKEGTLARKLQQEDDKFATLHKVARVKIIERGGGGG